LLNLAAKLIIREGEHAAIGVVDEDDFARTQEPLGDRQ
jgi:hypothetical protein